MELFRQRSQAGGKVLGRDDVVVCLESEDIAFSNPASRGGSRYPWTGRGMILWRNPE
jgi:hypothetical protein